MGKPMVASSSSQDHGPDKAGDGLLHTWWQSAYAAPYPQWIQVDLGSRRTVCRLVLKLRDDWRPRNQTLTVEGSADGSTFTPIVASASYAFAPHATVELPATTARYIRLVFTANSGPVAADGAGQLSCFEVYGLAAGEVGRAGGEYVRMGKSRDFVGTVHLYFKGDLRWDGEGGYTIDGTLDASSGREARRATVWLEYGGESESWKKSEETETAWGRSGNLRIKLSGKLALGEKLELRLGTWQTGLMGIGSTEYTDTQQYQISSP